MTRRATVLVADDQPVVAEALAASLDRWYQVVGFVTSLDLLDNELVAKRPNILLLDLSFGKANALKVLPALVARYPETAIVILTGHAEPALADKALRAGAKAYVVKQSAPAELRIAIEEALEGRTYLTPLMQSLNSAPPDTTPTEVELSERQRAILLRLKSGTTYAEIANQLGISTKTVEYHLDTISRRVGLTGRAQITRWADSYLRDGGPDQPAE